MLWLRSCLPTCPQDSRWELIPHRQRNPVNDYPVWDNSRNAHSWEGNTHNFLKNVTLQALNLCTRHTELLLQSQELRLLLGAWQGKEFQQKCPKKSPRFPEQPCDKVKPPNYSLCVNVRANSNPKSKLQVGASNTIWFGVLFIWRAAEHLTFNI